MDKPIAGLGNGTVGHRVFFLVLLASLFSGFLLATTLVPISESELYARSDVVVHGIVFYSSVSEDSKHHIETVTGITPLEVLKGSLSGDLILHQIGGKAADGRTSKMWESPTYDVGEEVIVYAIARADGDYQTAELLLGKFDVHHDRTGTAFVVSAFAARQAPETGVQASEVRMADGDIFSDPAAPRELEAYLRFLRSRGSVSASRVLPQGDLEPVLHPGFSGDGATPLWVNFNSLYRWNNNATAVFTLDGLANITGGGTAEAANAAATWNGEPNSTINYSIGANSSNLVHLNALSSPCGWSTCFSGQGVIGCSSISSSGTNSWQGDSYSTLAGGEVWLRAYCTANYFNSSITQAILTHELGHTLGLGHSDQDQSRYDVCHTDDNQAQMRSTVQTYTQLGTDDSDAVRWLYGDGGNSCHAGYTLTVTKSGTGSGSITSAPAWISCGPACSGYFATGTVVTLSAVPDTGYTFVGWSGAADCSSGSVTMSAAKTCTARFDPMPDLVVSALTFSTTTGKTGLTISVTDTTLAQTSGNPAPASVTRFYLSSDATLDASDVPLGSRSVPALASGGSSSATTVLTIPLGTIPGTYSIIAKADADGLITELNETNNTRSGTITISGPDLIVSALTPASLAAGASLTVSATTYNQGLGSAGASTTAIYLSTDTTLGPGDILLGSVAVGPLAYKATLASSATFTMPPSILPGSYSIIARADDGGVVPESLETNNTKVVAVAVPGPDLIVYALTVPTSVVAGASFTVSHTTKNQGTVAAPASTTAFYLSTDATLDAGDVFLGSAAVGPLAYLGTSTVSTALAMPPSRLPGSYYIIAKADDGGVVTETLETNNTKSFAFAIPGPDLIVYALTVPTSVAAGASFTVSATTMNQGTVTAPASTTAIYLSTDATLGPGDIYLGSVAVGPLAYKATLAGSATLTMPPSMLPGSYSIIAKADDGGVVAETVETNNTKAGTVAVPGPDLIIYALTVPTYGGAGLPVTVTATTKNQGTLAAPASTTAFYLSADAALGAGDVFLGSVAVGPLAASGTSALSATLTIPPATAPGSYYIIAKADDGGAVAETLETNNTYAGLIKMSPDLIISSLTTPTVANVGAAISITDITKNQGYGTANATATSFYLSTNTTFDRAVDILVGSRSVPLLAYGTTSTATTSLTIPAGTAPGVYYFIAVADDGAAVAESLETNNTKYSSKTVTISP